MFSSSDWQYLCVQLGELHQKGELSSQHVKVLFTLLKEYTIWISCIALQCGAESLANCTSLVVAPTSITRNTWGHLVFVDFWTK